MTIGETYASFASIEQTDDRSAAVSYIEEAWSPSADLTVVLEEREVLQSPRLMSYPPTDATMGYYVMWLPPVHELLEAAPLPRRVTFVIDTSGSMRSNRFEPLKNVLADVIETLELDDFFNVVVFNSEAQSFSPALMPDSFEEIETAARFVRQLEASGGTNFAPALQIAYARLDPAEPHSVVFLTDGHGADDLSTLNTLIAEMGGPHIRLFAIGVGEGIDRTFLSSLAHANGGESRFVTTEEGLEKTLRLLFDEFSRPVMRTTNLAVEGALVFDMHPATADLLAAGRELFQVGRYTTGGAVTVSLSRTVEDEQVSIDYPVEFMEEGEGLAGIPRLWAHQKVQTLENQVQLDGNSKLSDDILALGLEYRLVTSLTSLFAPDNEIVVNPEPEESEGDFATAVEETSVGTQTWLGRTFRLQNDVWIDLAYVPGMPLDTVDRLEDAPLAVQPFAGLGGCT